MTYKNDNIHRTSPWFADENLRKNQSVLDIVDKLAQAREATYAQIALAWLMRKHDRLVPIPGMRRERSLHENLCAAEIELSDADMAFIDATLNSLTVYGDCKDDKVYQLTSPVKKGLL